MYLSHRFIEVLPLHFWFPVQGEIASICKKTRQTCQLTVNTKSHALYNNTAPTAESHVVLVEAYLPRLSLDEVGVGLSHVVELECEEALLLAVERRAFAAVLRQDAVLQLVVPAAHRVLRLAVVVLRGQLLVLAGLVVRLVRLHLTCETSQTSVGQRTAFPISQLLNMSTHGGAGRSVC